MRVGIRVSPLDFGWAAFHRYLDLAAYIDVVHKRSVPGQHWYLWALGVDPPYQGQGIGGKLLQPVLEQVDTAGLPCYLETENERNLPFYQRYGFNVVSDGEVPRRGLRIWAMVREGLI